MTWAQRRFVAIAIKSKSAIAFFIKRQGLKSALILNARKLLGIIVELWLRLLIDLSAKKNSFIM